MIISHYITIRYLYIIMIISYYIIYYIIMIISYYIRYYIIMIILIYYYELYIILLSLDICLWVLYVILSRQPFSTPEPEYIRHLPNIDTYLLHCYRASEPSDRYIDLIINFHHSEIF